MSDAPNIRRRRRFPLRRHTTVIGQRIHPAQHDPAAIPVQAVLHAAPDAMVITNADGTMRLVNQQAERVFGYTADELIGQPIELLLPERLRAIHRQHRADYLAHAHSRPMGVGLELVARRKDGSEFAVEVSLSPLHTTDTLLITSVIRDVTDRKRVDAALMQQASLLELTQDAIFVRDMQSRVTYWNRGAEELYGWSKVEALGQQTHHLLHTEFPQPLAAIEVQVFTSGYWEGELIHTRRDGTRVVVASRWAAQYDSEGQPLAILETNTDSTERKRTEEIRAHLAAIVESSDDAIISLDLHGTILTWNLGAEQIYGYTAAEAIGHNVAILAPTEYVGEVRHLFERLKRGERIRAFETERVHKDGRRIPISLTLSPIVDTRGTPVGASAIARDITERKRIEAALREREQRFRAIFNQTFQFIGLLRPDGTVLEANQTALDFVGLSHADVADKPFWTTPWWPQTPESQQRLTAAIADAAAGQFVRYETEHIGVDGRSISVDFSLTPVYDDAGNVVLLIPEGRDITERKQAEVALRQSEERFARMFRASPAAISITRLRDGVFLDVNTSFLVLTGYAREEVIGHTTLELGVWSDQATRARMMQLLAEQRSITGLELKIRAKSGADCDLLAAAEFMELGGEICVLGIFQDITERKRVQEMLEQQVQQRTAHLNTLLTCSRELFSAHDLDAVMERAVKHALQLVPEADAGALYMYDAGSHTLALRVSIGFDQAPPMQVSADTGLIGRALTTRQVCTTSSVAEYQAEVAQLPLLDSEQRQRIIHQADWPSGVLALPLLTDGAPLGVLSLIRRTGAGAFAMDAQPVLEGLAHLVAAAIVEAQGRAAAAQLSSDLAQLQEEQRAINQRLSAAEARMLQAARLAAVGQLAASIAHEINNPLYAARNSLYLLSTAVAEESEHAAYLSLARDQLGRIARIIERMRDFYRPDRGELAAHDLNRLLEDTLALVGLNHQDHQIHMVFAPAFNLPPVHCNADQVRQVFLNLVLNGIDAMPSGGTLTVRTRAESLAVVEIQDTGVGIPDEVREHLFEPFWTSKPQGTGLGLSISGHIVTQHGGRIEVESRMGEGSLFRVVLPYRAEHECSVAGRPR
ncbi:MAG TPA: PAS domain S-box protein [Herpetosiphonaceae bacterium]